MKFYKKYFLIFTLLSFIFVNNLSIASDLTALKKNIKKYIKHNKLRITYSEKNNRKGIFFTDDNLSELCNQFVDLEEAVIEIPILINNWDPLSKLANLKKLVIYTHSREYFQDTRDNVITYNILKNDFFSNISKLKRLEFILLVVAEANSRTNIELPMMKTFSFKSYKDDQIFDFNLLSMPNLEDLSIDYGKAELDLSFLKNFPKIKRLDVTASLTDSSLLNIQNLEDIEVLILNNNNNSKYDFLKNLQKIRKIDISNIYYVPPLSYLPKLNTLFIDNYRNPAVPVLLNMAKTKNSFPNLDSLYLSIYTRSKSDNYLDDVFNGAGLFKNTDSLTFDDYTEMAVVKPNNFFYNSFPTSIKYIFLNMDFNDEYDLDAKALPIMLVNMIRELKELKTIDIFYRKHKGGFFDDSFEKRFDKALKSLRNNNKGVKINIINNVGLNDRHKNKWIKVNLGNGGWGNESRKSFLWTQKILEFKY